MSIKQLHFLFRCVTQRRYKDCLLIWLSQSLCTGACDQCSRATSGLRHCLWAVWLPWRGCNEMKQTKIKHVKKIKARWKTCKNILWLNAHKSLTREPVKSATGNFLFKSVELLNNPSVEPRMNLIYRQSRHYSWIDVSVWAGKRLSQTWIHVNLQMIPLWKATHMCTSWRWMKVQMSLQRDLVTSKSCWLFWAQANLAQLVHSHRTVQELWSTCVIGWNERGKWNLFEQL